MQKGRLKKWQDDKGFGFIRPDDSDEEIFVHISALKHMQRRPVKEDILYFNVSVDGLGRRKAVDVSIEGVKSVFTGREADNHVDHHRHYKSPRRRFAAIKPNQRGSDSAKPVSVFIKLVALCAIVIATLQFNTKPSGETIAAMDAGDRTVTEPQSIASSEQFQCEGKTHCSQMTSCQEAMFYLNHCPGTVTDGDGDGRPCEDQWCGY